MSIRHLFRQHVLNGNSCRERVRQPLIIGALLLTNLVLLAQDKPRVFIEESNSWGMRGAGGGYSSAQAAGAGGVWAGKASGSSWSSTAGGARGQTAELIKTFGERCPDAIVNNNPQMADYDVKFDHEGGKGWGEKHNKIAVFNRVGDSILARSTRSLGNSVKDACAAIVADWRVHGRQGPREPASTAAATTPISAPSPASSAATDSMATSTPVVNSQELLPTSVGKGKNSVASEKSQANSDEGVPPIVEG